MKRLFIVEPEDLLEGHYQKPGTGFTSPIGSSSTSGVHATESIQAVVGTGLLAKSLLIGMPLVGLPLALILAAAASKPLVSQVLGGDGKDVSAELKEAGNNEIRNFMRKYAITLAMAKEFELIFPPGHPEVGQAYVLHPLADFPNSGKDRTYIPQEKYDELLLQERESELIKLQVALGAIKIRITQKDSRDSSNVISGHISGGNAVAGSAEISAEMKTKSATINLNCREFELSGKAWNRGDKLDRSMFAWVHFEPAWEALIMAREVGGCTKAAVELRENTSFSSDKALAAKVKAKVAGGSVAVNANLSTQSENAYLIQVEFAPFVTG